MGETVRLQAVQVRDDVFCGRHGCVMGGRSVKINPLPRWSASLAIASRLAFLRNLRRLATGRMVAPPDSHPTALVGVAATSDADNTTACNASHDGLAWIRAGKVRYVGTVRAWTDRVRLPRTLDQANMRSADVEGHQEGHHGHHASFRFVKYRPCVLKYGTLV